MLRRLCWQYILIELICLTMPTLLVGFWIDYPLIVLLIALCLYLLWQFYNQLKLSNWLWEQNSLYPPTSVASWNTIFYGLHKRQKRNRQRQNELAELIKRFRSGAESLPDALLLIAANGNINWCNKLAQYQLNIRWPDDQGQNITNLIRHPEFANYIHNKNFAAPLTLLFNRKNYVEFRILPYIEGQWIVLVRDVDQLYLAEKLRHDFFSNASHELRTPITVVQGYLDLLMDKTLSQEKQQRIFQIMQEQSLRMELLIKQISMLSKIENSPIKQRILPIDIPNMLKNIAQDVLQIEIQHQLECVIDETLHIEGNEEQLYSAISNLIYNAIKHTPEGTTIKVSWIRTPQGAHFSVVDNGPGIAPHHLSRLTERFYRVDESRENITGGSGLGLAIVKHALINHSNTKLEISSTLGIGSTFSFTLPAQYVLP